MTKYIQKMQHIQYVQLEIKCRWTGCLMAAAQLTQQSYRHVYGTLHLMSHSPV